MGKKGKGGSVIKSPPLGVPCQLSGNLALRWEWPSKTCVQACLWDLPPSPRRTAGPHHLGDNSEFASGLFGGKPVFFPVPVHFCPSAVIWPGICQRSASKLWASPSPQDGAIPSPHLRWNWCKNVTNSKAELWCISKLRVEKPHLFFFVCFFF